jgi:putative spermidine/putrescine transport system ATP-binding protein
MAFLELNNVQKKFATATAVENFNLNVERGEFVSFLGPSGCGKTTTLRMIAGFELPTNGSIRLNGSEITNRPPNKRNIGMVFQSYALFPNLTVADNIAFGLNVAGKDRQSTGKRVEEMLKLIALPHLGGRYPYQLSGGQQQRVALARALAIQPQVLLLDEPLSALDAKIRVSLRQEIRSIQRTLGITTIYVTHDQEEAMSLSDRIVVMSEGRMEQVGTPFEIYNFPKTKFVASFVGTLNQLQARVLDGKAGKLELEGQTVHAPAPIDNMAGESVAVALRPEMLSLESGGGAEQNKLQAVVEDTMFLGSIVRTRVRVRDNVISLDTFNNPHLALPRRDEVVTVWFPREAVLILQQSGAG